MIRSGRLPIDYWTFWLGQTISNLGNAISAFVLPLLMFELTGSPVQLALTTAAYYLPYALFGLVIGAWVDRVDRKRLMIATDLLRAVVIAIIPIASAANALAPWLIYVVMFAISTLGIAFNAASFAAVPLLVPDEDDLIHANARLQAGFSAAALLGPALAGLALVIVKTPTLLLIDALSYFVSAASLLLVARAFQTDERARSTGVWKDVHEGLLFVLGNPLLRNLAAMAALINFFLANTIAQIVLLARDQMHASKTEVGWFFSAASAGVILFSLAAPRLRRSGSYGQIAIAATIGNGLFTLVLAASNAVPVGLVAYAGVMGTTVLFSLSTATLRQQITPSALLGRVISTAMVLAWSVEPVGAVAGGVAIDRTGSTRLIYAVAGIALVCIGSLFALGPVGRGDELANAAKHAETAS